MIGLFDSMLLCYTSGTHCALYKRRNNCKLIKQLPQATLDRTLDSRGKEDEVRTWEAVAPFLIFLDKCGDRLQCGNQKERESAPALP